MAFKMKGSTFYGKPTGNKASTNGSTTVNRKMDKSSKSDGRAKSSAFQKKLEEVTVSGGPKTERHTDKFKRVKKETDVSTDKAATLATNYGGTWKKGTDKAGNTLWLNEKGQNVKEAAVKQGKAAARDKAEYIAANKTT